MIKNKRKIVQFSPMRSGSTLVASLLRELFPGRTVRKLHSLESISRKLHIYALNFPVVSTCRYPLDVIASQMKAYDKKPTAKAIEEACQTIESRGLLELKKVLNRKNVLLLKYEDYYENFDFLFDHFEDFFGINIDEKIRLKLSNDYSIKSVKQLTEGLTVHQFTDDNTHFHGRHISETKGKPGAYRSFFTEEQIESLQHRFSDVIKDFSYCNTEIDNPKINTQ